MSKVVRCIVLNGDSFDVSVDADASVATLKSKISDTHPEISVQSIHSSDLSGICTDSTRIDDLSPDMTVFVAPISKSAPLPTPKLDLPLSTPTRTQLSQHTSSLQKACGRPSPTEENEPAPEGPRRVTLESLLGGYSHREQGLEQARELFEGVADDGVEAHLINAAGISEEMVSSLSAMGFEQANARRALLYARKDLNGAVEKLLDPSVNLDRPLSREAAINIAANLQLRPPGAPPPPPRRGMPGDEVIALLRGLG